MPILQPGAEVKFYSFHRSPIGLSPEGRKASLLVFITVHLLLVFISSKNSSCNWEWHFENAGNVAENIFFFLFPSLPFCVFCYVLSQTCGWLIIPNPEQNAKAQQRQQLHSAASPIAVPSLLLTKKRKK